MVVTERRNGGAPTRERRLWRALFTGVAAVWLLGAAGSSTRSAKPTPPRAAPPAPAPVPAPTPAPVPVPVPAAVPPPAPAPKAQRVMILPFKSLGASDALAQQVTDSVAQRMVIRPEYSVLTSADLEKLLSAEATKTMLGCDNTECVAKLSNALQADLLLTGSLGRVGNRLTLSMALLEPHGGRARNQVQGEGKDERALVDAVPGLVASLMGWAPGEERRFSLPAGTSTSLAVLDLLARGVAEDVAGNLTQVLSSELKRIDGTSVISREDISALLQLQENKLRAGCDDMECLAEIGGALGVDRLVTGSVGKVSGSFVVSLRLISTKHNKVENLVTEAFSGAEDQLLRAVKRAGRLLLGVDATGDGSLAVTASEQGAQVMVNGVSHGRLPLRPIGSLAPGLHRLLVIKGGYVDWSSDVYVDPGETTAVWVDLVPRPVPWFRRWQVWAAAGAAGTLTLVTTLLVVGVMVSASAVLANVLLQNTSRVSVSKD